MDLIEIFEQKYGPMEYFNIKYLINISILIKIIITLCKSIIWSKFKKIQKIRS